MLSILTTEEQKKAKICLIAVFAVSVLRILFYVVTAIRGIGVFAVGSYFGIVMILVMYISIIKYLVDYYRKGKDVTIDSLLFRYAVSSLASLIRLRNGDIKVFVLTALTVFLVPYLIGIKKNDKKTKFLILAVWLLSFAVSVLFVINPVQNYLSSLGTATYNLDAINPVVEWTLFCILGVVWVKIQEKKSAQAVSDSQV